MYRLDLLPSPLFAGEDVGAFKPLVDTAAAAPCLSCRYSELCVHTSVQARAGQGWGGVTPEQLVTCFVKGECWEWDRSGLTFVFCVPYPLKTSRLVLEKLETNFWVVSHGTSANSPRMFCAPVEGHSVCLTSQSATGRLRRCGVRKSTLWVQALL